jgi:hypothetical protein
VAIEIRTRRGLTRQQDYLIRRFLGRLDSETITTTDLIALLIMLRGFGVSQTLLDWCDTIAHPTRNRGQDGGMWRTGQELVHEARAVDRYFDAQRLTLRKIPRAVFTAMLERLEEIRFALKGLALKPAQRSADFDAYTRWFGRHYQVDKTTGYYRLRTNVAAPHDRDRRFLLGVLRELNNKEYGREPLHFDAVFADVQSILRQLVGRHARALKKRKQLFALHFLCAFHQIEVIGARRDSRAPCYLTVDATATGHLSLNFAIYQREGALYDQRRLRREENRPRHLRASHTYSRPYLVTDLLEEQYLDRRERDDRLWGTLFRSALRVRRTRKGYVLARVTQVPLKRDRFADDLKFFF